MTLRAEFGSLSRQLSTAEEGLLRRYGQKGQPDQVLRRLFTALLTESPGDGTAESLGLTENELEVLAYYLKYPEEATRVLSRFPPRTQATQICSAVLDHYLIRHNGRFKHETFYSGPRHAVGN